MAFMTMYHTQKGANKQVNQDALMIKTAQTAQGPLGLFVVCDGMGGLGNGEVASARVIAGLSQWFENTLPELLMATSFDEIPSHFVSKIEQLNHELIRFSKLHQLQSGTTLTALLILGQQFYTFQIGDSRAYLIRRELSQLTKDQTVVAREIERGTITQQEAYNHPDRHVLLQCIGVESVIEVDVSSGELPEDSVVLLCTDGFYNRLQDQEIVETLHASRLNSKAVMQERLHFLQETVQSREETDDITAIIIKNI